MACSSGTEVGGKGGHVRCPLVYFSLFAPIAAVTSLSLRPTDRDHSQANPGTEGHLALTKDRAQSWPHPGIKAPIYLQFYCSAKWSHGIKVWGLPNQGHVTPNACDREHFYLQSREGLLMLLPLQYPSLFLEEPLLSWTVQVGPTPPPGSKLPRSS